MITSFINLHCHLVFPLSLAIVSTYSCVDTILQTSRPSFKMTRPDGCRATSMPSFDGTANTPGCSIQPHLSLKELLRYETPEAKWDGLENDEAADEPSTAN